MLRTYSSKVFKRTTSIQKEKQPNPVTVELPWASIKTRFHIFFALSIFFLVYSFVMFLWVRIAVYPLLEPIPFVVNFLFWLHTILISIGVLFYSMEIDDKYLQDH